MKSDEDIGDSKYLGFKQEMQQLGTDYSSKAAFITPEIAAMDKQKIDAFIQQEPGLKIYRMPLYDILRMKPHTLSEKEEKILAEAGLLADGPSSIYGVFSNAELPYPKIELSDGTEAELTKLDCQGIQRPAEEIEFDRAREASRLLPASHRNRGSSAQVGEQKQ